MYLTDMLARFEVAPRDAAVAESRSGAGVVPVETADGRRAFVKLTPATLGPAALAAARRELRFYRDIAPHAPIATPRLLDAADTDDGVAVLLEAAGEPVNIEAWTPRMWAAFGRDLAALHSMPVRAWDAPDELGLALADPDLATVEAFWRPTLPRLDDLLSHRDDLETAIRALPPVFVHGDCHTANIVHVRAGLVFLDWQASGTGRAGSDLAFVSVSATPAGVAVPPDMLDSYLDHRSCNDADLRRVLLAEELAVFILQWPHFAAYNSESGNDRVRRRTRELAEQWFVSRD